MKKKIIIGVFLFLTIFLSKPKTVYADCINKGFFGCDGSHPAACSDGNTCCSSASECGQYPGPTPAPSGGGGGTIPSNSGEKCGTNGINTAIGCIPALSNDKGVGFMGFILRWSVGVGGGIAFLLTLYGSFMVMTSQGNPERVKAGQELITSSVSGLMLIILSVFILKFIGVDILGLSSFGFN